MNDQQQRYKEMQQELMRQIQVTMKNKALLQDTLKMWQEQLKYGSIDAATYARNIQQFLQGRTANEWNQTYDSHIKKCNQTLVSYAEKINELESTDESKGSIWTKVGIVAVALVIFFTFLTFSDSKITGFFIFGEEAGTVVSEDGYMKEGAKWVEIKGSRIYERCIQVEAKASFNAARIRGKITSAIQSDDLLLTLYTNNINEPGKSLGACTVKDYDALWKSCVIRDLQTQAPAHYWICAAAPSGEQEQVYYTIAYSVGDQRKTALWTGQNWQKLDRASYTLKAQFLNNEK